MGVLVFIGGMICLISLPILFVHVREKKRDTLPWQKGIITNKDETRDNHGIIYHHIAIDNAYVYRVNHDSYVKMFLNHRIRFKVNAVNHIVKWEDLDINTSRVFTSDDKHDSI